MAGKKKSTTIQGEAVDPASALLADERPTWIPWVPRCYTDPHMCKVGDLLKDGSRPICSIREVSVKSKLDVGCTLDEILNDHRRIMMQFRLVRLPMTASPTCPDCTFTVERGAGTSRVCSGGCLDGWAWLRVS